MRRPVLVAALVVALPSLVLGAPGGAVPVDGDLEFFLGYDPPADCPARADFEYAVSSRTPEARMVVRERATLVFDVDIATSSAGTSALLVATLPDGTRSRRDVHAESCSEAVATLAVIVALAIDGYRSGNTALLGEPLPAPPPLAPPPKPTPSETATPGDAVEPKRVDEGRSAKPREPSAPGHSARLGAYVSGAWESAVAPSAPFGVAAGFELGWNRTGIFRPSVRAGVLATLTATETSDAWTATFRLTAARVGACPVVWGDVNSPALHGCVELDGGVLEATGSGSNVSGETPQSMTWLAAGLAGRGEWPLATWVSIEASAGLRLLANHDRFVFRPETEVYDVPWLSVGFGLGLVGRLP